MNLAYYSYIRYLLALGLTLALIGGATAGYAQHVSDAMVATASARNTLGLRLKAPTLRYGYTTPRGAYVRGGSTVFVDGDRTVATITLDSPIGTTQPAYRSATVAEQAERPRIEIRIAGRHAYLSAEAETMHVVDLTGRQVIAARQVSELSLESLRPGVYILRCERQGVPTVIKTVIR